MKYETNLKYISENISVTHTQMFIFKINMACFVNKTRGYLLIHFQRHSAHTTFTTDSVLGIFQIIPPYVIFLFARTPHSTV